MIADLIVHLADGASLIVAAVVAVAVLVAVRRGLLIRVRDERRHDDDG